MLSVKIANEWFESNRYQDMKKYENEKKAIEKELYSRMGDERRFYHKETELVLKLISNNRYNYDTVGLNEFLDSYGILPYTIKFNVKDLSSEVLSKINAFRLDPEYYVKLNVRLPKQEYNFSELTVSQLLTRWKNINSDYKELSKQYEEAREVMLGCTGLNPGKPVKFNNGSISKIAKQPEFDYMGIVNEYGSQFVIENAEPVITKVTEFMNKGYFLPSEIKQYKELKDVGVKFVILNKYDEDKIYNMLGDTKSKASIKWENIRNQA